MSDSTHQANPDNQPFGFWGGMGAAFLCVLFGANTVAVKITFMGFGVLGSAAIRFFIAAVVITAWALIKRKSFRLQPGQWRYLLVFSTFFTIQLALFYAGLDRTYASRGALLINLMPFLVLVLAHLFIPGDTMTRPKVLGLLLGFAGVACVLLDQQALSGRIRSGDLIVLVATFVWAANTIYLKRVISAFEPFHIVLYSMLFSVPFLSAGSWFFDEALVSSPSAASLLALLYQSLITGSFGFLVWNTLLKKHGAVAMHSFIFIMPIAAVLLAGVLLGDPMGPGITAALVLIVAGVVVVHSPSGGDLPPAPEPREIDLNT